MSLFPHDLRHILRFTGIRGWHQILASTENLSNNDFASMSEKTIGGLEIIVNFAESLDREKIIERGRAAGWSPPLWYELEAGEWLNDTLENGLINVAQGVTFIINVSKVWIPKNVLADEKLRQGVKHLGCYIRYKFYHTSKCILSYSIPCIKFHNES